MIKIIRDKDSLLEIRSIWNQIFVKDNEATPFQRFEYIYATLSLEPSIEKSLFILMVKDDPSNQWIAMFPFVLDKKGTLRFINARHTDFCAPLINHDFNDFNLYKEVSDYISGERIIKRMILENIVQYSQLTGVLKPHFRYMITHDMNFYSSIKIYSSVNDKDSMSAFRHVRAKQIKNLRKSKKQTNTNCTFEIYCASNGQAYPQKEVDELVGQMLADGIRVKEYFSDRMLAFWKELYNAGVLSAALLYENGEVKTCNFMYYDDKHNEYIKWLMLYKENSWNMKINIMIADYLYNHGGATINFARGIYDYKLTNFHPDVKPLFCVRIAKTPWGHIKNMLGAAFHYSKPIIKTMLRR